MTHRRASSGPAFAGRCTGSVTSSFWPLVVRAEALDLHLMLFFRVSGRFGHLSADLFIQHHQFLARHPQVRQGEQGGELGGVFLQPAVAPSHVRTAA